MEIKVTEVSGKKILTVTAQKGVAIQIEEHGEGLLITGLNNTQTSGWGLLTIRPSSGNQIVLTTE